MSFNTEMEPEHFKNKPKKDPQQQQQQLHEKVIKCLSE